MSALKVRRLRTGGVHRRADPRHLWTNVLRLRGWQRDIRPSIEEEQTLMEPCEKDELTMGAHERRKRVAVHVLLCLRGGKMEDDGTSEEQPLRMELHENNEYSSQHKMAPLDMDEDESKLAAARALKKFGIEDADVPTDMEWLEQDDPVTGAIGVTPEMKKMVDQALIDFDKQMIAEGRPDWRRELAALQPPEVQDVNVPLSEVG